MAGFVVEMGAVTGEGVHQTPSIGRLSGILPDSKVNSIYGGVDDSWCNQRFGGSLVYPEPRSTTYSPAPTGHRPFPLEIEL